MVNCIRIRHNQPYRLQSTQQWCSTKPYPLGHLSNELEYHLVPESEREKKTKNEIRTESNTEKKSRRNSPGTSFVAL